jgi:hypothetical protein
MLLGVAVSVTTDPPAYAALQVASGQLMPEGLLDTAPEAFPANNTESKSKPDGTVNVPVRDTSEFITTTHSNCIRGQAG